MSPMSVEERRRILAEQRRKWGYREATPSVNTPPSAANMIEVLDGTPPHEQSSCSKQPTKKRKAYAPGLSDLIQADANDPPTDSSGSKHLKVETTATAEGPVKIAWDSQYPLNRVLSGVLPPGDADKATAIGFGHAMAAIKTYGTWSSFMAYLVETSFRKSVEEYGKCEEELAHAQGRVTELLADVQKYEANKKMLEGKLSKLGREAKEASTKVKDLENELENELEVAQSKLRVAQEGLKKVEDAIVSEFERILTLWMILEECKLESVTFFDSGFNTAMAQIQIRHLEIDLSGMDLDKIVAMADWLMHRLRRRGCSKRKIRPGKSLRLTWMPVVAEGDSSAYLVWESELKYLNIDAERPDVVMP